MLAWLNRKEKNMTTQKDSPLKDPTLNPPDLVTPVHQFTEFWTTEMNRFLKTGEKAYEKSMANANTLMEDSKKLWEAQTRFANESMNLFTDALGRFVQANRKGS
jgi:hypothetical protein